MKMLQIFSGRQTSRWQLFPFAIVFIFQFCIVNSSALAQRITPLERQAIREIKITIDQANRHLRSQRIEDSVVAYERAIQDLTRLAGGARNELTKQLFPEYQRLEKLFNAMKDKIDSLPELTSWTELVEMQSEPISFRKDVAPIIVAKCGNCHIDRNRGSFSAASFAALDRSTMISYGLPDSSRLVEVIVNGEMPQGGLQVDASELDILKNWIRQGAKFDGTDPNMNLRQLLRATEPAQADSPRVPMASGEETVSFSLQVAPILIDHCGQCHMINNPRGNFSQANFVDLLRGGNAGAPIVPGKTEQSLLLNRIESGEMPPNGRLPQASIDLIKTWILEGAKFDQTNPALNLVAVAAVAKAKSQTHAELLADRKALADRQWKLVMDRTEPHQLEAQDFRILGAFEDDRLESLVQSLEKDRNKLTSVLKVDPSEPLVKGNVSIFIFEKRYDFGEFARMIEGRDIDRSVSSIWNYSVTDAYIAILFSPGQTAREVKIRLTQQLAALHVASLAPDVPRWFSDGVGYWVAARLNPRDDQIKTWDDQSLAAINRVSSSAEIIEQKIERQLAGLVGYQWVKALKRKSASFEKLIHALRAEESFDEAFRSAYGISPGEMF